MTKKLCKKWRSIQRIIKEEFREQVFEAHRDCPVDWDFAKKAVTEMNSILDSDIKSMRLDGVVYRLREVWRTSGPHCNDTEEKFWKIYEFLMNSFETLDLRETTIAADLLRLAYYYTLLQEVLPATLMFGGRWVFSVIFHNYVEEAEFQKFFKMAHTLPFLDTPTHVLAQKVLWNVIRHGREQILSSFLKYGMVVLPSPEFSVTAIEYLLYTRRNNTPPEDAISDWKRPYLLAGNRLLMVRSFMEPLAVVLKVKSRRLIPTEPLQNTTHPSAKDTKDRSLSCSVYFRCLQRVFETIPDPFVSSDELRKSFRHMYLENFDEEADLNINELISEFEDLYPEGANALAPRSLKHLSRCEIRERLRQSGALPHGVKDLKLPKMIQKYIILE